MKRYVSFLLIIVLLATLCVPALAESKFDFTYVRSNDAYDISVDSDQDCAFITTTLTVAARSFTHELESDTRYSSFESDILVNDYYEKTPYGIMRTWITYSADEALNITSVSFYIGDKEYIFSGIGNKEWHYQFDDGIMEQVLIIYDNSSECLEFLLAVLNETNGDSFDSIADKTIKMVLHGTKDVTATVGIGPLLDLVSIIRAFFNSDASLSDANGSTLKVVDVQ